MLPLSLLDLFSEKRSRRARLAPKFDAHGPKYDFTMVFHDFPCSTFFNQEWHDDPQLTHDESPVGICRGAAEVGEICA